MRFRRHRAGRTERNQPGGPVRFDEAVPRPEDRRSIDRGLREVLRANERAGKDAIQEILGETMRRHARLVDVEVMSRSRAGTIAFSNGTHVAIELERGDRAMRSIGQWVDDPRTDVALVGCRAVNARWHCLRFQTTEGDQQDVIARLVGAGGAPGS